MNPLTVHIGDALTVLRTLPSESINCCITSPPYYGLRDYKVVGQFGAEATPADYVSNLVTAFSEVRRVLRNDGTLWLNLGDSYAASGGHTKAGSTGFLATMPDQAADERNRGSTRIPEGFKVKDLIGIPWRVAFALQAAGWYLRQDIIWHKPNPMPESVKDRCTKAHEYLFMLAKSERYCFDADAIAEPSTQRCAGNVNIQKGHAAYLAGAEEHRTKVGLNAYAKRTRENGASSTRNKRSVWTIPTRPYREAHFATFPPALVEPCILAGCPVGGIVLDPFAGSGTVGQVALDNARFAILIELNPNYAPLIAKRCRLDEAEHSLT